MILDQRAQVLVSKRAEFGSQDRDALATKAQVQKVRFRSCARIVPSSLPDPSDSSESPDSLWLSSSSESELDSLIGSFLGGGNTSIVS